MEMTPEQVRARLDSLSVDDTEAVHDLYLKSRTLLKAHGRKPIPFDNHEAGRRAERMLGKAITRAQERGEIRTHGQNSNMTWASAVGVDKYVSMSTWGWLRLASSGTDEEFELVLKRARESGDMSQRSVCAQIRQVVGSPPPLVQRKHTARGKRTIEYMAMQVNSLALGVEDLDPAEVDAKAFAAVIEGIFDDLGILRSFLRRVKKV